MMIEPSDQERAELPETSAQYMEELEAGNVNLKALMVGLVAAKVPILKDPVKNRFYCVPRELVDAMAQALEEN